MRPYIFRVWHADSAAPNDPRCSTTLGADGTDEEARVRQAAEKVAALDADQTSAWPTEYRVLDVDTGRLWKVRVDCVTRPTYGAIACEEEPPMLPAVHVLWHGKVACADVRLGGIPSSWPEGQCWMSLGEFSAGHDPMGIRCDLCWERAVALVERNA